MKKDQTWVKDQIEYGLEVWYFVKDWNDIRINSQCPMSFHEFDFEYKQYLKS